MTTRCERITLRPIRRKVSWAWTDLRGNVWLPFEVDYDKGQEDAECAICGRPVESGWVCLASCEEICPDHIIEEGR
jgi:hypothetical protein